MSRLHRLFVSLAVAFALLMFSLVIAQAQVGITTVITEVKKGEKKVDAKAKPVVKGKAVRAEPVKAIMAAPVPAAAVLDPLIQQFSQQLRPILRGEYHVVVTVCKLSNEQRRQLAREGEQILRATAKKFAELQQNPRAVFVNNRRTNTPNPRIMIQEGMVNSAKAHLSAAELKSYQKELDKRNASRREVTIRNVVARLDQDLILTALQREKLTEALTTNWNEEWCPAVEMFIVFNQFVPFIPDQYVTPYLNLTQKKVWDGTQKQQLNFWGVFGFVGNMIDDLPLDDELEEARKAVDPPAAVANEAPVAGGLLNLMKAAAKEMKKADAMKKQETRKKEEVKK